MQRFAVIGLGQFGEQLARALTEAGAEVIAIDRKPAVVERLRDEVSLAVRLDATDKAALLAQGVGETEAAIVGIGTDFESAVLTVATLKEIGVPWIVARAGSEIQARILQKVGADAIASAERESAFRWAHRLTLPKLEQYVELGEDHSLIYLPAPPDFCNKTLVELRLRKVFGVNLVAIRRNVPPERDAVDRKNTDREGAKGQGTKGETTKGEDPERTAKHEIISVPGPDTTILPEDILIIVGSNENLSALPT